MGIRNCLRRNVGNCSVLEGREVYTHMRLTLALSFLSLASHLNAYPIVVRLENQLDEHVMLLQTKTHRFMPVPSDSSVEFTVYKKSDWVVMHRKSSVPLDILVAPHQGRYSGVPILSLQLAQENGSLHANLQPNGLTETGIPSEVFIPLLKLFQKGEPSVLFTPDGLVAHDLAEPWLLANYRVLSELAARVLEKTQSPLFEILHAYLEKWAPAAALSHAFLFLPTKNVPAHFY